MIDGPNEAVLAAPRPAWRRLAHCWGIGVPGLTGPREEVVLVTRDGIRLAATYLSGPPPSAEARGPAVVVAHGFLGHRRKPAYALLAEALARRVAVLTVDLRGHGGSGGRSTLGALEVLDLGAAAAWLRARGHGWVCGLGASMGATAVLRAAGLPPHGRFDAVCAVSAPAAWGLSDTPATRALTRVLVSRPYRLATALTGHVRIASSSWVLEAAAPHGWLGPGPPIDVAAAIAPTPLLVVHGEDDHVFGVSHAAMLVEAAGSTAVGWLEPPGFGHAEDGLRPAFVRRLADAVAACARDGAWGERHVDGG